MIPVTSSMSSSFICIRMPSGGFFSSSLSSRMTRRMTAGGTDCEEFLAGYGYIDEMKSHHVVLIETKKIIAERRESGGETQ